MGTTRKRSDRGGPPLPQGWPSPRGAVRTVTVHTPRVLRGTQRLLAFAAACVMFGVLADGARASLWLEFSAEQAAPGDTVTARTLYTGAFTGIPAGSPPIRVFLLPADEVSITSPEVGVTSVNDSRLVELGALTVDVEGNGELVFTVPEMQEGRYTTVTHCVPCAPYSAGRELLATGPTQAFVILADGESGFPPWAAATGAALGLVALMTTLFLVRSRRLGQPA